MDLRVLTHRDFLWSRPQCSAVLFANNSICYNSIKIEQYQSDRAEWSHCVVAHQGSDYESK